MTKPPFLSGETGSASILQNTTEVTAKSRKVEESDLNRFSRFFSLTLNLFCIAGFDGYFKYLSDGWETNLGYTKQELLNRPFEEFIHPEDRTKTREEMQSLAAGSPTFSFENRYCCKDGSIKWLLWNAEVAPDEGVIYAAARDITPRKLAEQELERVSAQLSAVLNAATEVSIISTDVSGVITLFNVGSERMLGYIAEEMVGKRTPDSIHLLSEVEARENELTRELGRPIRGFDVFAEPARLGCHEQREWTYVRKDGTHLTVSLVVTAMRDANENLLGFLGVAMDITRHKAVLQALQETEERWQLALRGNNDGIWDWNVRTNEVIFSPRWKEMLGYEDHEIENHLDEWARRVHPDDRDWVMKAVEDHFQKKTPYYVTEHRVLCKDGSYKWILDRGQALWNESGKVVRMAGSHTDITERKRNEEALRKSEERYRNLTHAMMSLNDCVYITDLEGKMIFVNEAFCKTYGYDPGDVLGQNACLVWREEGQCDRIRDSVLREGQGWKGEVIHKRKDGEEFPVLLGSSVVRDDVSSGSLVTVVTDITERRKAEHALRQSEWRYRELVDSSQGLICTHDLDGVITVVNPAAAHALGYEPEELVGKKMQDFLSPDVRSQFVAYMQRLQSLGTDDGIMKIMARNGEVRFWSYRNSIQYRPDAPPFVLGHAQDATERIVAETALARSEAKTRALLQALPDILLRINGEGVILEFLAPRGNSFPISPAEMTGKKLHDVVPTDLAALALHHIREALRTRSIEIYEYSLPLLDKMFDHEVRIVVSGENEVLAILRDISARREAERMKSEFISIVSHELRTPLTSILGSLELISAGVLGDISKDTREAVDIAYYNADRLLELINDILDIEKIESGRMTFRFSPMELLPLVEKAIAVNQSYGDRFHVRFQLTHALAGVRVNGDERRLMQVLSNLLSNAAKFSAPGSCVQISMLRSDPHVRISIRDHGPGVSEELRTHIFHKFAQADSSDSRQKGGTGLGLSISKAIVERHGGRIGYENNVDQGATFFFEIPIFETDPGGTEN